ncbi:GldG family protein [bacterium]|nr:GldG family protein [bacterium]
MEIKNVKTRKIAYGTNTVILILSLLGIIFVVNYFFSRHFIRFDLTEKKEYSISTSTKSILAGLDDIVAVTVYFSSKLPPYMSNIKAQVRDMLEEFQAYSKGNFQFEFVDPTDDPDLEQKLRLEGIPQVQLNVIEKDKAELLNAYLGMSLHYADKKEAIPVVRNIGNLEYDLASLLVKLTSTEIKTIGLITEHTEASTPMDQPYNSLKKALEKQYQVQTLNISNQPKIPDTITTLIIASPESFTDEQKFALDQFVMRGGKLIVLIDNIRLQAGTLQAEEVKCNLGDLLSHYGLKVDPGLVLDVRYNEMAAFSMGYVSYQVPYPFFPRIPKEGFHDTNPAVNGLETLVLPWTAPVSLTTGSSETIEKIILAESSPMAFVQKAPYDLNPQQRFRPSNDELGSVPLAVAVTGKFRSFWAGKQPPSGLAEDTEPPQILEESPDTQIVLIGSSQFIKENFLRMTRSASANLVFMSNLVDWMTLGQKLISIRSRNVMNRPLAEISEGKKAFLKYFNILGVSLLVVGYGLIRLMIRKRSQKLLESIYG